MTPTAPAPEPVPVPVHELLGGMDPDDRAWLEAWARLYRPPGAVIRALNARALPRESAGAPLRVLGSAGDVYTTRAVLVSSRWIVATCSCPNGQKRGEARCYHGVAAIFVAVAEGEIEVDTSVSLLTDAPRPD